MHESDRPLAVLKARAASRAFLLLTSAAAAAAWAAGCSDDPDPATPQTVDAGPDVTAQPPDAETPDAPAKRDCSNDLNDEKIWTHLECSGLYASFADKQLAPDVLPYKPAVEFWSDGAEKQRWIHLPPGTKIDISDWNEWSFPVGTKIWKEFKIGGKRIETRLFTKIDTATWAHTSYRWNADETDAVAKGGGESIAGIGPDGGTYEIPNAGQCEQCHFGRKDQILGFDAVSLGMPGAEGITLADAAGDRDGGAHRHHRERQGRPRGDVAAHELRRLPQREQQRGGVLHGHPLPHPRRAARALGRRSPGDDRGARRLHEGLVQDVRPRRALRGRGCKIHVSSRRRSGAEPRLGAQRPSRARRRGAERRRADAAHRDACGRPRRARAARRLDRGLARLPVG
jgi:hypothetical protein